MARADERGGDRGRALDALSRPGPILSTIAIEDGAGSTHSHTSIGAGIALRTGDDGEVGFTVARYGDLSSNACTRELTLFSVESHYYPVGPEGVAPFASTGIGLARVTDQDVGLLGLCNTGAAATTQVALGFGLGARVSLGPAVVGILEGRFFQVPNSAIQALEGRANVSVAFGRPDRTELRHGTVGPAAGFLISAAGPIEGRGPVLGVRFRRNSVKSGVLGLQVDYAPLRITEDCSSQCDPSAILFAPAYEPSVYPAWGRVYAALGPLLAGFASEGPDRGIAQGAHGGVGADVFGGQALMWNANARVLWFQRNDGDNVFLIQAGVSLSRRLGRAQPIESR